MAQNINRNRLISMGAGVAAVAAIAGGTLFALGSNNGSSSALGLSDSQLQTIATNVAATPEEDRDAYLEKLAANLGVDVQKLKDAIKTTNLQVLDEKVADGSVTQEQADKMRERIEEGGAFFFGMGGRGGHGGPDGMRGPGGMRMAAGLEDLAGFLGVDEATLRTELGTKSLADVAAEHGKSRDELKAFLTENAKTALAGLVADGKITQEQADQRLSDFTSHLDDQVDEVHARDGHGPRGGMQRDGAAPSSSQAPVN